MASAPGTGSALFNGSSSFMKTASALNLSSYTNLTVQWFMKAGASSTAIAWEHGDVNAGVVPGQIAGFVSSGPDRASLLVRQSGDVVIFGKNYSVGDWHHVAVTIQSNAPLSSRYHFYVDYSEVGSGFTSSGNGTSPAFINDILFIGARSGSSLFFGGNIDELAISDEILSPSEFIPEPSSAMLLTLGALVYGLCRKRL
jgi:hypothetical protein